MKNFIFSAFALFAFSLNAYAQPSGGIWTGSRSATGEAKAVHAAISSAYDAFMPGGNLEVGWAIYSDDAAEIDPGGNITFGKKALREGWDGFMKVADEAPKFKYENVLVRMLTNDVALAVWDAEADIKIQGQQLGGKTKGSAVLRKVNGQWKLEFDQITSVIPMPEAGK
ncbi:MAG: YybH family protein [Saprospiraceae bacterium]